MKNKTIESIWQNGFIADVEATAPKVNALYDSKSQDLLDKFEHMFKLNQRSVLIMAAVLFTTLSFLGAPFLGAAIAVMLYGLVRVGQKQLTELKQIHKGTDCYHYLVSFSTWLTAAIEQYAKIYKYFYPVLFILCSVRLCYSDFATSLFAEIALEPQAFGIPLVFLILIAIVSIILGRFGGTLYRADVNLVYGKEIKKLEELIKDMETLRS